jgi:hypothetical protein
MNHKTNGFLLFEFLITSLLAGTLLIIVYQSYQTANKGVQYIKNNADFQMQKILLQYQLELDSMHIFIPDFIYDLYPKIKNYFNKEEKDINTNSENKIDKDKESKNNTLKKELDRDFKLASVFFPELKNTKEEIKISWISSRKILGKNSFIKINYLIKLTDKIYKEKKLYRLYRREDTLENDYSIKHIGNEYTFITYILDPEIHFIMPKIPSNSEKSLENNKKEKDKDDFFIWTQNPIFIAEQTTPQIDLKNMLTKAIIPFTLLINGTMIAYNFSKELDMQITASFPIADYALQMLFNNDIEKQQSNNTAPLLNKDSENKKDEIKENNPTKPLNQNTNASLITIN